MLIEFSVKNFLSFKNKVTLSLEKGTGEEIPDNIINNDNTKLLKTISIYGANASGKSNLLKAFSCAILMIKSSNVIPIDGKWSFIKPFLFDDTSKNKPCEFEFAFITNNTKYKYFFSALPNKIIDEKLDAYYSQKATNIFTRRNTNDYEFTNDKNKLESIALKNTENKLFLSSATTWNYDKTKEAFLWFTNSIDTYTTLQRIPNKDLIEYSTDKDNIKTFALKLLKEADIFIKDISVNYEEKEMDITTLDSSPDITKETYKIKNINIELEHEVKDNHNIIKTYKINFEDESSGTKILFAIAPLLKRAFENTKVLIVDELEKSIHPTLVEFIIKLFNNKEINKANSQLIFTTHSTNLLNLDLFRRDQIWFTEKNPDTGVSELYPLDSFSVRKDENIQKGYINGRYGAIPFINDINI